MADYPSSEAPPPPPQYPVEPPQYAPLPPEVTAAQATAPLPAPPQVPHAYGYLEEFQLAQRLRMLRATVLTRANNAAWAIRLAGIGLSFYALASSLYLLFMTLTYAIQDESIVSALILMGVVGALILLPLLTYGVTALATAGRLFPYHYRLAWQRFMHENDTVLMADEERLRILQDNLPGRFWGSAVTKQQFTTLADRLEFGAFHLPSLRELARNPEHPPRAALRRTEVARRYAHYFNQIGTIIACCVGSMFFNLYIILVIVSLTQGPKVVQAYARLAAFIDFYLEEPQIHVAGLPPAPVLHGWWDETTAPWKQER